MHKPFLRSLAFGLLISIAVAGTHSAAQAAPATPDDAPPFRLTVFPHLTDDVNFWNSWGAQRSGGRRHQGIDIMSPRGTKIVAVADGVVTKMDEARLSGYFIRIDHGDGWATSYMHLNNDILGTDNGDGGTWTAFSPLLQEGDEVKAGDVIGYVGDSGNAEGTRPHTHFEIKFDGRKQNPYTFLTDAFDRETRFPAPTGRPL